MSHETKSTAIFLSNVYVTPSWNKTDSDIPSWHSLEQSDTWINLSVNIRSKDIELMIIRFHRTRCISRDVSCLKRQFAEQCAEYGRDLIAWYIGRLIQSTWSWRCNLTRDILRIQRSTAATIRIVIAQWPKLPLRNCNCIYGLKRDNIEWCQNYAH